MSAATFYFDLGSPFAYLASERLAEVLPEPVELQPISLGAIFKLTGRSSWALGGPHSRRDGMAEVEHRAAAYGLPPLRWPEPWPGNYLTAMRAATYARREGRGDEFARQAFRAAFEHGEDLSLPERVFAAAARAGLDPVAVEQAVADPTIKQALREATDRAHSLGVFGVPTIAVGGDLLWGDDRLEDAAALMRAVRPSDRG